MTWIPENMSLNEDVYGVVIFHNADKKSLNSYKFLDLFKMSFQSSLCTWYIRLNNDFKHNINRYHIIHDK